jgi:hypothetical protein
MRLEQAQSSPVPWGFSGDSREGTSEDRARARLLWERSMSRRVPLAAGIMIGLFCLLLFTFGAIFIGQGVEAIRSRHFEHSWRIREHVFIGPVGHGGAEARGKEHFQDFDGIRIGIGMSSLGAMLIQWSLGLALPSISSRALGLGMTKRKMALIVLTLTLLSMTATCFWPPWRIGVDASTTAFWCAIGAYLAITCWMFCRSSQSTDMKKKGRILFIATVASALGVGHFIPGAFIGIAFGFTFYLVAGINIYLLTPRGRSVYDWKSLS